LPQARQPEQLGVESLLIISLAVQNQMWDPQLQAFADQLMPCRTDDGIGFADSRNELFAVRGFPGNPWKEWVSGCE
jgi:hypothetical protein